MTQVEVAEQRAIDLNAKIDAEVTEQVFGNPTEVLTDIRAALLDWEQENVANNLQSILKYTEDRGIAEIVLGPQIDKGETDTHFRFDSGARLSFGITLRRDRKRSFLVSYRFHYVFRDGHSPSYIWFDLNSNGQRSPLRESRSHLHPGLDDTRLPYCVLSPFEILDRIFIVLDSCQCTFCALQS